MAATLGASGAARRVTVEIAKHAWARVAEAGVRELVVLRTAGSAFSGFPRDRYTTLKETRDRIFATAVSARWRYGGDVTDFNAAFAARHRPLQPLPHMTRRFSPCRAP